ncbi:MAG: OmpA family protein [Bacteroidia bacterium]|nr:OmpA family protein [Bacteroidia bacterium]MDO9001155.1 OmpA family protein [Bacteroidota bacterium]MDP3145594.1 OmpA family protein [Bacteroidota bacterium]
MKKVVLIVLGIMLSIGCLQSQTKFQKFFWSKKYKACLAERDGLCSDNKQLKKDTLELHELIKAKNKTYDSLSNLYNDLNASYKSLANSSDKKLSELNASLENKSKELAKKEKNLQEKDQKLKELQSLLQKQDSVLNALNNTVKNALLGFKSDEFAVEMKNGKVYVSLSDKLLFKSGNANVEDKGKDAIKKLSEVLNKNTDIDIAIEGHTDNVPIKTAIYKDNWDLSVARSTNIVRMICDEFGVESKRVTASGKGEYFPVATNETPEGRAKNRRTEIVLSPKLEELFKLLNSGKKN